MTAPPTNTVEITAACPSCGFPDALWVGTRGDYDMRDTTTGGTAWTVTGCHCDPTNESEQR